VAISIPDRVIVFDYGEVISRSPSEADKAALVAAAGAEPERFWAAYWQHRDDLDGGRVSIPEYWARIAAAVGAAWDGPRVAELWALDVRSWLSVEPGTVELLAELAAGGTRTALLSNAGYDFGDLFRRAPWSREMERVFLSAELGLLKPEPAIYHRVADELDITFDQFVFIDNRPGNVDAAVALGATGHVFDGVAGLRAFLERLAAESLVA
jgi:putative hydrolase of the HAD superfamily